MSAVYVVKLENRYVATFGQLVFEQREAHRFVDTEKETAKAGAQRVAAYREGWCKTRVVRLITKPKKPATS